ncbi:MAG: glutamate synthase [Armatimonadota bacterium]|nr:glutamate synthase [Armatimonadota bacterium]MDR7536296.1 glutamate synthase [Armatimonadota bacterium]
MNDAACRERSDRERVERERVEALLRSRRPLAGSALPLRPAEAEGGCGVVGLAASVPVRGRHILQPCVQMHNRGNGKGGGLAACGLVPQQMGVDGPTLASDYLIQVALLDESARAEVETAFLSDLVVHQGARIPTLDDHRELGLEVRPPDVWRYFARVRPEVLERFVRDHRLEHLPVDVVEDEYVSQWAFRLNRTLYSEGRMRAFVLSYGRDMLVLKVVGYAEQAFRYYRMDEMDARVWIGHQRYPTKGRVWHPGGAHPFAALDVALVHNGDFANYHAVCEYLAQRGLYPLFLTDTEVAVLLFDLWARTYRYPLEYLLEAMAPTTERDFLMLPPEKRRLYRAIQAAHIHGSPDGPWFFIVARTLRGGAAWQLIGITDTSMLRPQVFSLQEGEVQIGIIASEKQAIDATLRSLAQEDPRICPVADLYWNARGGSYTDGGAFVYTVEADRHPVRGEGAPSPTAAAPRARLTCTNKFGEPVRTPPDQVHHLRTIAGPPQPVAVGAPLRPAEGGSDLPGPEATWEAIGRWAYADLLGWLDAVERAAVGSPAAFRQATDLLTALVDRRYPTGQKRRASVLALVQERLYRIFRQVPAQLDGIHRLGWASRRALGDGRPGALLLVDGVGFPSEGPESLALFLVEAGRRGWREMIVFDVCGQRFIGNGFGPHTGGIRIDVYGSPGDYLGSGLDGLVVVVHGSGQDQYGQILKSGRLIIHGDVGQTFMYGAKGGEAFVLGNAAGRALINAVGHPRVVINGTALDYLAESFMAGLPVHGGGFVVLNGIRFDTEGRIIDMETPYPGGNLFSLASGGAIYVRDPHARLDEHQLNGGRFANLTDEDWATIRPYLEENERLFGISIEGLLTVDGRRRSPREVYRKVEPVELAALK